LFRRVSQDFQLTIVLLYGFFSAAIITPFAIYRFLTGANAVGVLDASLVLIIAGIVMYGWKFGKTERTGRILVVIGGFGALLSSEMLGVVGLFWMYVAIVANFFLTTNMRFATVFTIFIMILLAVTGKSFENGAQMWSFLATGFLLSLLSFIIAQQYSLQRRRLEHLATIDPLTGALNRRSMEQELQMAVEEFSRSHAPMAVILMDIDHFKYINDRCGHDKGDQVLQAFANLVMLNTRHVDRFFRYGGEEFLLLLKSSQTDEAMAIAEKIRAVIADTDTGILQGVTVSLGLAPARPGETVEQWTARADAALYSAKNQGRNRVERAN
jgi:diguanylate cyclase